MIRICAGDAGPLVWVSVRVDSFASVGACNSLVGPASLCMLVALFARRSFNRLNGCTGKLTFFFGGLESCDKMLCRPVALLNDLFGIQVSVIVVRYQ